MNAPLVTQTADVARWLPVRKNARDTNKGTFGHVLILAGSKGFVGAPVMAAEAAARTGAGLITLATPEGLQSTIAARVSPVVMTRGLKQAEDGTFASGAVRSALALGEKVTSVALGPGLGQNDEVAAFVREFVAHCPVPLVIDADALNVLAHESDHGEKIINDRAMTTILTPHPGEMARLLGVTAKTIQEDREGAVSRAARKYGCIALLKGARTLITDARGTLYLNPTGNPGMATGGTGDVLTGVIAALLAQHLKPLEAAVSGAYIHGLAGDLAAAVDGDEIGMIATDVIAFLPKAIGHCHQHQEKR